MVFESKIQEMKTSFLLEMAKFTRHVEKIVQEDPRRVIHSLKVGFALTLVSLLYYLQPLYKSFGISAMWAIITVLLVFEFSAGNLLKTVHFHSIIILLNICFIKFGRHTCSSRRKRRFCLISQA